MVVLVILLLWWVETGLSDCESVDRRLELATCWRTTAKIWALGFSFASLVSQFVAQTLTRAVILRKKFCSQASK